MRRKLKLIYLLIIIFVGLFSAFIFALNDLLKNL